MRLRDLEEISQATDLKNLQASVIAFAHARGFGLAGGALVVQNPPEPPVAHRFGNVPEAYKAAFESPSVGSRDPVLQRMKRSSLPFVYDQSMYLKEHAADLWEVQAEYGYKTGIATAFHLPNHKYFCIGLDREESLPDDDEEVTRLLAELQLMAAHALNASIRLSQSEARELLIGRRPTARELEVLRWTLAGKTAWEVGMLLNISERTAAIHANRATHKLECVSKHQAALKAMRLGLI